MQPSYTFVLVEPENPDNIGAAARAVKNMGIKDFRIVNPPKGWKINAKKMAVWAYDIVQKASVFSDLKEALKDCHLVIGTTCRHGAYRGQQKSFGEAISLAQNMAPGNRVAFLFGKESKGLSNEDIAFCDYITTIPTHHGYTSLNLAQAVLVIAFKLNEAVNRADGAASVRSRLVPVAKADMDVLFSQFREILTRLNYRNEGPSVIDRILTTFHDLLKRSGLARHELNMFKGFFRRLKDRIKPEG